ncbi:MAG: hypothetical protein R3C30_10965 [Hyphomonadaceae bacterium]
MAERMNMAAWSGVLGTWVSIAAAAGGGYLGLQTYNEEVAKMEDARVVQTFALYDMFSSEERLLARQRILDAANSGSPYVGHDLWLTLDFFDALEVCVKRDLCDQDLAVRLFQPYAVPIWTGLESEIVGGRTESDPNMGGGVEWLAGLPTPPPVSQVEVQAEEAQPEEAVEPPPDETMPDATAP